MADQKDIRDEKPEGDAPDTAERPDVLTNAFRRLDNRFRGVPNDASLIGEDLPEEEDLDPDAENDPDADEDDPDRDRPNRLW